MDIASWCGSINDHDQRVSQVDVVVCDHDESPTVHKNKTACEHDYPHNHMWGHPTLTTCRSLRSLGSSSPCECKVCDEIMIREIREWWKSQNDSNLCDSYVTAHKSYNNSFVLTFMTSNDLWPVEESYMCYLLSLNFNQQPTITSPYDLMNTCHTLISSGKKCPLNPPCKRNKTCCLLRWWCCLIFLSYSELDNFVMFWSLLQSWKWCLSLPC